MRGPLVVDNDSAQVFDLNGRRRSKRAIAKDLTTLRVKASARFLFQNVGYFSTGIRDVAARIGMSTGAVFATVEDKPALWRLAFDGPPPSEQLAEEVALVEALRRDWSWLIRKAPDGYRATLTPDGWNPLSDRHVATGQGVSPAAALRAAREQADRLEPLPSEATPCA